MQDRDFKGVWIPKVVWLDERLNALDKCILAEIDSLDNGDGCWASNEYIAKFCQCSVTKVSTSISKLIACKYLTVASFDGRKRFLKSSLSNFERQTFKICKADIQNLKESNTYNNPFSIYSDEEERAREDTVEQYAVNNLQYMSERAMQELASFKDDLPDDVIRHAIDNALDKGVRNWSYVRAILNSYAERDVKSLAEAKAVDEGRRKGDGKESGAQADYDEDHRPRAVIPDREDVEYVRDENDPMGGLKM